MKSKITPKQALLVSALLTSPTLTAAAQATGISDVTAWRWLRLPQVEQAYRDARRQVVHQAITNLQRVCTKAVDTLEAVMGNRRASPGSRVSAARATLELAIRAVELEDLEARIAALEARIAEQEKHP